MSQLMTMIMFNRTPEEVLEKIMYDIGRMELELYPVLSENFKNFIEKMHSGQRGWGFFNGDITSINSRNEDFHVSFKYEIYARSCHVDTLDMIVVIPDSIVEANEKAFEEDDIKYQDAYKKALAEYVKQEYETYQQKWKEHHYAEYEKEENRKRQEQENKYNQYLALKNEFEGGL